MFKNLKVGARLALGFADLLVLMTIISAISLSRLSAIKADLEAVTGEVPERLANSSHTKGEHCKGTLIHDNATDVLIVGNLYAHNFERNQLFKGGAFATTVNNLIYDPGGKAMHYQLNADEWVGKPYVTGKLSIVGNVLIGGPSTETNFQFLYFGGEGDLELFAKDNPAIDRFGRVIPASVARSTFEPYLRAV